MTRNEMEYIARKEDEAYKLLLAMQEVLGIDSPQTNCARAKWVVWYDLKEKFVLKHDTEI